MRCKCRPRTVVHMEFWLQNTVCALCMWSSDANGESLRVYMLALYSSFCPHICRPLLPPSPPLPGLCGSPVSIISASRGDPTSSLGSPCPPNLCRTIKPIQQNSLMYIMTPSHDCELVSKLIETCDGVEKACCDIESTIALYTGAVPDSVAPASSVIPSLHMGLKTASLGTKT